MDADYKAYDLQQRNRESESLHTNDYSSPEVRRAVVYTREDLTLVVSYLSTINRRLKITNTLLILIAILVTTLLAANAA